MTKTPARRVVDRLLEGHQGDLRFDLDARVEVWVTEDDLRFDRRTYAILTSTKSDEEKRAALMQVAVDIANQRLGSATSSDGDPVTITADVSPASVNVDSVDWGSLLHPDEDELEDEELERP